VGSFTNFACEDASSGASEHQLTLDALIEMPGVPNGMGAVLFCKGDRPKCLEVFTYGNDHWEGVYDGFTIEQTAAAGERRADRSKVNRECAARG
jgi:hypothetical protein